MPDNNTVILRVQLSEEDTQKKLQQLVLDIEATRKAQAALTAERKAGTVSDEEFAKRSVDLQVKLKGLGQEQSAVTKTLDAYRAAMGKATGSVDQLKAQSALLTAQYNAMSKEERENTEAGRELAAQLEETNKALLEAGQRVGDNRRNVGNYSASLKDAIKESGFFGGVTAKVTEAQETFSKAQVIAKAAIGGNVTALGFLRLALLATGLGALVVVLGSVVAFLTKSQAGVDLVSRKFAGLKAIVSLVTGAAAEFGETLFKAAENPKQALIDLVAFIEGNLVNRFKALGIIFDGLRSGSINKLSEGLFQLTTGFTDVTGKVSKFADAALNAAKAGEAIEAESQRILRAERALNVERSESRARIEELKKLSDDSTKSVAVRTLAAKEAARIENGLLAQQLKLQDDKIKNTIREANLDKQQTNEELDAIAELRAARADTQQESLTLQTELQNKINSLGQEGLDKTIAGRAQSLALQKALLDKQLAQVQTNSDEELDLLQAKLQNGYQAELNVKDLTVKQKAAIDAKYENDSLKLTQDYSKQRALAAYDAEAAAIAAELTLARTGSQQETDLKVEAINSQLARELAALDKRADNEARANLLRANAEKAINDTRYASAQASLEQYLQGERNALDESYASGKIKEDAYNKAILTSDITTAAARLQLAKTFKQDGAAFEQQLTTAKIASIKSVTEADRAEQAKRVAQAQQLAEGLTALFADTVATTGATLEDFARKALILVIDSLEKTIIAAQIKILAEALATPQSAATFGVAGFVQAAATIAAVTAASALLKSQLTPPPSQFAMGTVLGGASHADGGVQLYSRSGHHFGEAEKDEIIMTKGVWQNPLLRPLASQLNVLGGGAPLMPRAHMALGGVTSSVVQSQIRPAAAPAIDYQQLANALRKVPLSVSVRDTKAAAGRDAFTESQANA
jgi:hypothetical protein